MTDRLFKIKPLKWHEAADDYWIAANAHYSYGVVKNRLEIWEHISGRFVLIGGCTSILDGKAQAEHHHFDSVAKDLIEVVTK